MTYKNIYVAGIVGSTDDEKMQNLEVAEWSNVIIIPYKNELSQELIMKSVIGSESKSEFKINKIVNLPLAPNTEPITELYDSNIPFLWNTFFNSNDDKCIMATTYDSRIFQIYYDETINDMVAEELYMGNIKIIKEFELLTLYNNLIINNIYMVDYENKKAKFEELLNQQIKLLSIDSKDSNPDTNPDTNPFENAG
jgi:hypothetical protein